MPSGSIADTDKPFLDRVLQDYDVIEMEKTALPLPTYHKTTTKLQANKMEGIQSNFGICNASYLL